MGRAILFLVLILTLTTANITKNDIYDLCSSAGYIAEPHDVITNDGYILTIFRIKKPLDTDADIALKEPVIVQHGVSGSAEQFAMALNESLAFFLTEENYDVWVGNHRGNFHGRRHVSLNPSTSREFWEYSLDQHGKYDTTAIIDYILNVTKREKLSHIGHSQGSGMFFAMTAGTPEYNDKIKVHISLAPGVYTTHTKLSLLHVVGTNIPLIREVFETIGIYEIPASFRFPLLKAIIQSYCGDINPFREATCPPFISLIEPVVHLLLNMDYMALFTYTQPAGVGLHEIYHYSQIANRATFGRYDWGLEKNLKYHNSITADPYDLSKVTAPVAILYGENDGFIVSEDVARLASELPNVILYQPIANNLFTHADFLVGKNLTNLLNKPILEILNTYRS